MLYIVQLIDQILSNIAKGGEKMLWANKATNQLKSSILKETFGRKFFISIKENVLKTHKNENKYLIIVLHHFDSEILQHEYALINKLTQFKVSNINMKLY